MPAYTQLLGLLSLGIEATLPIPQILKNQQSRSCAGFRLSVLGNWLVGDIMKMMFFFFADSKIPFQFKACGIFQFLCDMGLGLQFWAFGDSSTSRTIGGTEKDTRVR